MPQGQINITGTSGEVQLRYTFSSIQYITTLSIGTSILIDSTSTNITYTTLSGDAIASSSDFSITNLIITYNQYSWQMPVNISGRIDEELDAIIGTSTNILTNPWQLPSGDLENLVQEVNSIDLSKYVIIGYKTDQSVPESVDFYIIMKSYGNVVPELRVSSGNGLHKYYFKGSSTSSTLPADFIEVFPCDSEENTTTTTSTTSAPVTITTTTSAPVTTTTTTTSA